MWWLVGLVEWGKNKSNETKRPNLKQENLNWRFLENSAVYLWGKELRVRMEKKASSTLFFT